jgi:hypothetical protein
MVTLTKSICWSTVVKSQDINGIGVVIYQKPASNSCYLERKTNQPHLCSEKDGSRFPWYVIACPLFFLFFASPTEIAKGLLAASGLFPVITYGLTPDIGCVIHTICNLS